MVGAFVLATLRLSRLMSIDRIVTTSQSSDSYSAIAMLPHLMLTAGADLCAESHLARDRKDDAGHLGEKDQVDTARPREAGTRGRAVIRPDPSVSISIPRHPAIDASRHFLGPPPRFSAAPTFTIIASQLSALFLQVLIGLAGYSSILSTLELPASLLLVAQDEAIKLR